MLFSRLLWILLSATALGVVSVSYAYFIEPDRLVIKREELKIKNFDPAFDGLTIATISDAHGGSHFIDSHKLRTIVETTNALKPDMIVLLGDYVSQSGGNGQRLKMPMSAIADGLSGLDAKYGVFAVLGNHDGWFNDTEVAAELTRVGYRVLQNEVGMIEKDGRKLRILGLKDHLKVKTWRGFSDEARQALAENGQDGNVIVLEHSPDILPIITGDFSISPDLRLILAAHTHGGQVWFPLVGTPIVPSSYGQKYSYGLVRENGVDMFVDSGIGTSILPVRFMMPPQIALLTIRSE